MVFIKVPLKFVKSTKCNITLVTLLEVVLVDHMGFDVGLCFVLKSTQLTIIPLSFLIKIEFRIQ